MTFDGFEIDRYREGWRLKSPYQGKDREGNPKTQFKESYHSSLKQLLIHALDLKCKDSTNTEELFNLLTGAHTQIAELLSKNGLVDTSTRLRDRVEAVKVGNNFEPGRWFTQEFRLGRWVYTHNNKLTYS